MIEVRGLTKRFGTTVAVDNLTFRVRPGRVTGFLGPNGAGKSTTMRLILGLDEPTSGFATVQGRPYRQLRRPLRTVGALLDARWVHPRRSALSHLRWLAAANDVPASRVDEVLGLVGLSDVAGRNAGGFSLGMSQRLGLAAALLGDPPVLMFDEPVNGLDPEGIRWVRTFLQSLAAEGRTVLVSSHMLSEMALTAAHLIVIGRGRLLADTSTREFTQQAAESLVQVRSPQLDRLRELLVAKKVSVRDEQGALLVTGVTAAVVGDLAGDNGITLHELSPQQRSLEEAFMQMTSNAVQYRGGRPAPQPPGDPRDGTAAKPEPADASPAAKPEPADASPVVKPEPADASPAAKPESAKAAPRKAASNPWNRRSADGHRATGDD